MAQYDVYLNPNVNYRPFFPYVVDVQHQALSLARSRLTMPLARFSSGLVPAGQLPKRMLPSLQVEGEMLVLMPHLAASVSAASLKKPVANLTEKAFEIQSGLDAVLSGV
jgi:toxin CcdB